MQDQGLIQHKGLIQDQGFIKDTGLIKDKGLIQDKRLIQDKGLIQDQSYSRHVYSFLVLCDKLGRYLIATSSSRLNYEGGGLGVHGLQGGGGEARGYMGLIS